MNISRYDIVSHIIKYKYIYTYNIILNFIFYRPMSYEGHKSKDSEILKLMLEEQTISDNFLVQFAKATHVIAKLKSTATELNDIIVELKRIVGSENIKR